MKELILNSKETKNMNNELKEMVRAFVKQDDIKLVCNYSKSGKTLKSIDVSRIGSSSRTFEFDLVNKVVNKIYRNKIVDSMKIEKGYSTVSYEEIEKLMKQNRQYEDYFKNVFALGMHNLQSREECYQISDKCYALFIYDNDEEYAYISINNEDNSKQYDGYFKAEYAEKIEDLILNNRIYKTF